jgi:hypothetical protein
MNRSEICLMTALITAVVSTGLAITLAQAGAVKSCQAKGPAKCQVAAIRAW